MKLLILLGLLCCVYCFDDKENVERRIAGGGNYRGFIGLTTYGAEPVLAKGKYDREFGPNCQGYGPRYDIKQGQSYDEGSQKYENPDGKRNSKEGDDKKDNDSKKNGGSYEARYIGYEDVQSEGHVTDVGKKNDDNLEYLGYRGGYGYCIGEYGNKDGRNRGRSNYSDYYDDKMRNRCDQLFGYTGPTANDEPENLIRPCALNDWQCIRKYFAANGRCKPAYGPIPDPLYIDVNTLLYSVVNRIVTLPNLQIRGLSSAKIIEFYVNKKSGNLVFAIDVTNLNETIPRAYFRYRRTAKESIVLADFATVLYRSITFTAVIPKVPNLRLDLADIHPDIHDSIPLFFIGPGAANSTDPEVVTAFTRFSLFLPIAVREEMIFQAQLLTSIYIQENICDFGLKLISV